MVLTKKIVKQYCWLYFVSTKISYGRSQRSRLLFYVVFSQPNRSVITIFCGKTIQLLSNRNEKCTSRMSWKAIKACHKQAFSIQSSPFCFHFLRTKCRSSYIYIHTYFFFGSLAAFTLIKIHRKVDLFCFFFLLSLSRPNIRDRQVWSWNVSRTSAQQQA